MYLHLQDVPKGLAKAQGIKKVDDAKSSRPLRHLRQVTFVSYKPFVSLSSSINIYPSVLLFYSPFLPEHQLKRYPRRHQPPARAESPLRRLKISPTSPCGRQLDEPTYPQRNCVAAHGRVVTILLAETATVHHDRESIPTVGMKTVIYPQGTADPRNGIPPPAAAQ